MQAAWVGSGNAWSPVAAWMMHASHTIRSAAGSEEVPSICSGPCNVGCRIGCR